MAETLLFYAARRDHLDKLIRPSLERGRLRFGGARPAKGRDRSSTCPVSRRAMFACLPRFKSTARSSPPRLASRFNLEIEPAVRPGGPNPETGEG